MSLFASIGTALVFTRNVSRIKKNIEKSVNNLRKVEDVERLSSLEEIHYKEFG